MATATPVSKDPAAQRHDRPYRLSVAQHERMGALGILSPRDRVSLRRGRLIATMTKNPPHSVTLTRLYTLLIRLLPRGWHARSEQPVRLSDVSMPGPDVAIIPGNIEDYLARHPTPADIALLIEVADPSLAEDRGEALQEYARESVPISWIVNIPRRRVEVHSDTSGPADAQSYGALRTFVSEDKVPVVLDGRAAGRVAVRDVLP